MFVVSNPVPSFAMNTGTVSYSARKPTWWVIAIAQAQSRCNSRRQADAVPVVLRPVERVEAPVALSPVDKPKLSA